MIFKMRRVDTGDVAMEGGLVGFSSREGYFIKTDRELLDKNADIHKSIGSVQEDLRHPNLQHKRKVVLEPALKKLYDEEDRLEGLRVDFWAGINTYVDLSEYSKADPAESKCFNDYYYLELMFGPDSQFPLSLGDEDVDYSAVRVKFGKWMDVQVLSESGKVLYPPELM